MTKVTKSIRVTFSRENEAGLHFLTFNADEGKSLGYLGLTQSELAELAANLSESLRDPTRSFVWSFYVAVPEEEEDAVYDRSLHRDPPQRGQRE